MTDLAKLPPQSLEAEQQVLGAVLIENAALDAVMDLLTAADFYSDKHRSLYSSMVRMWEKGQAIDLITLSDVMHGSDPPEERMRGSSYIALLASQVPTAANVKHHARIVREKSILRQLLHATYDISSNCYGDHKNPASVEDLLDRAEESIFQISQQKIGQAFEPLSALLTKNMETIERISDNKGAVTGLATGFVDLDRMTAGLQPQDLIIVAGRPSMGKTSFCLNIAEFAAVENDKRVAIFSLETSREQLVMRMVTGAARVDAHKVRSGYLTQTDWPKLTNAHALLNSAPIFIDDTGALSIMDMRKKARRLKADQGLDLIIVDYLQLMRGRGEEDNREQEISAISRALKALAKEMDVPVIALSQLNRAVETRGKDRRPLLSDLRESGAIEQDADVILFLYREEVYNRCECPRDGDCLCGRRGTAEAIVGKQRNGPIGVVPLTFIHGYTRFENAEHRTQER